MDRKELHQKVKDAANDGGYDFVVVDTYFAQDDGEFKRGERDPDGSIPVCDRVPLADVIPGDQRWAWSNDKTFILFASKEDEEAAEQFISSIHKRILEGP